MNRPLALLLICLPLAAQERHHNWQISISVLGAAETLDSISSRGLVETNPLMGRGPYGVRQEASKGAAYAAVVFGEWLILRKHPAMQRGFTVCNYTAAGATVMLGAVPNWRLKR